MNININNWIERFVKKKRKRKVFKRFDFFLFIKYFRDRDKNHIEYKMIKKGR